MKFLFGAKVKSADDGDSTTDEGGLPDTVEGPLNDRMADAGKLFGDLYKILRYEGGEASIHYDIVDSNDDGAPEAIGTAHTAIGGEPELSEDFGWYAAEVINPDETISYVLTQAPIPSLCVQPVADYARWGDISPQSGLDRNRLPLIMSYDATWWRTECEVGQLIGDPQIDDATGAFITPAGGLNVFLVMSTHHGFMGFIEEAPGGIDEPPKVACSMVGRVGFTECRWEKVEATVPSGIDESPGCMLHA